MITGELKSKIDRIWDAFWSGGTPNPLEVIEQITYLLFIRRLDDLHTLAERKANRVGGPIQDPIFKPGQNNLRWAHFKSLERDVMHKVVGEQVFPFLQKLRGDGSTYSEHMKDARFTIPTAQLLGRVVDMLDDVPMQDRDTNGDLYEYMLSKIASGPVRPLSGRSRPRGGDRGVLGLPCRHDVHRRSDPLREPHRRTSDRQRCDGGPGDSTNLSSPIMLRTVPT